jgi:hypothetical protein
MIDTRHIFMEQFWPQLERLQRVACEHPIRLGLETILVDQGQGYSLLKVPVDQGLVGEHEAAVGTEE